MCPAGRKDFLHFEEQCCPLCVPFSYIMLETHFRGIQQLKSKMVIVNRCSERTGSREKRNSIVKRRI